MLLERNENQNNFKAQQNKLQNYKSDDKELLKENNHIYNLQQKTQAKPQLNKNNLQQSQDFFVIETDKVKKANLMKILGNELLKQPKSYRSHFLKKHGISSEVRARMVDWMIEVLSSFNCTQNTFFVSIDIMDQFLNLTTKYYDMKEIHLIGVTCMLIASKMEEIIPFKATTVEDKMTHGKIKKSQIVKMEMEILQTLNFNLLQCPSLFIFIEFLMVKLNFHQSKNFQDFNKIVIYVSKMIMFDYDILRKFQMRYIGASAIYICLKIIEQITSEFQTRQYVERLKSLLTLEEQKFYNSSEKILDLAKNFEKKFQFAKNLIKFDSFSLEKKQQQLNDFNNEKKIYISNHQ